MATAHMVHGFVAAGKTTFARRLASETGAIRLSADEWYLRLYVGEETTSHLDPVHWERLVGTLDDLWPLLLQRGVDVVLDYGFWSRSSRDQARRLATSVGGQVRLYRLVCEEEIAKARCLQRNDDPRSFHIDELAFDHLNQLSASRPG